MPKNPGLPALELNSTNSRSEGSQPLSPPMSPRSPGSIHSSRSNPSSPRLGDMQAMSMFAQATNGVDVPTIHGQPTNHTNSPQIQPVPISPPSPSTTASKHGRDPSKSIFSNIMASKSSHRLHSPDPSVSESADRATLKSRASSKERTLYGLRSKGSTPDLPRMMQNQGSAPPMPPDGVAYSSGMVSVDDSQPQMAAAKKGRSRLGGILNRTKSTRVDEPSKFKARSPTHLNIDVNAPQAVRNDPKYSEPIQTAPVLSNHREKAFAEDNGGSIRNRSADRQHRIRQEEGARRDKFPRTLAMSQSFMTGLQQTGKGVGKAGKGLFERMTRSGSTTEREFLADDNYVCSVINLPLVKQTRKTRIARRLELSKDKTEFWMPALPWRCIE